MVTSYWKFYLTYYDLISIDHFNRIQIDNVRFVNPEKFIPHCLFCFGQRL